MPIYEYRCEQCSTTFEKLVSFSQVDQPQDCPHCHSQETRKQITAAASRSVTAGGNSSRPSRSPFS
ncbi:MAG: zinc ribbon domain-containing protein [Anaerolineaceae bacterium]|jgi:putative FmdB family regulatory protein|nr:zinc ribbon domain-containing protein [Anaerolineaceae bacterium]